MNVPRAMYPVLRLYGWFRKVANSLQSPLLLLVRLYWGWQLIQTGWGKLHNLPRVTAYFASLGIPFPAFTTHFVADVELLGGILLAIGLFSRFTGLVIAGDMVVAYWTGDHTAMLSVFSDPGTFYGAAPYTFLFAAVLVLIFGAGVFSLDFFIKRSIKLHTPGIPNDNSYTPA